MSMSAIDVHSHVFSAVPCQEKIAENIYIAVEKANSDRTR